MRILLLQIFNMCFIIKIAFLNIAGKLKPATDKKGG